MTARISMGEGDDFLFGGVVWVEGASRGPCWPFGELTDVAGEVTLLPESSFLGAFWASSSSDCSSMELRADCPFK